jgi:hypothetical protein
MYLPIWIAIPALFTLFSTVLTTMIAVTLCVTRSDESGAGNRQGAIAASRAIQEAQEIVARVWQPAKSP